MERPWIGFLLFTLIAMVMAFILVLTPDAFATSVTKDISTDEIWVEEMAGSLGKI